MNEWEQKVVKAARNGEWADLRADQQLPPVIKGSFIRRTLLGLPLNEADATSSIELPETGIRIRGATVDGDIDLTDGARASGEPLPVLALEECTISSAIKMSHCRLSRLSLHGSRITHLAAHHCEIGGTLDVSDVASAEKKDSKTGAGEEGLCWLELQGAKIKGDIRASRAELCAPVPRESSDEEKREKRFALQLRGAEISGSVFLYPEFRANGGVSFHNAKIQGDVWCLGAELIEHEGEGYALNIQSATIGGHLMLAAFGRSPFRAMGTIWLYGAHIKGELHIDKVIVQKFDYTFRDKLLYAVIATNLKVDLDLIVTGSIMGLVEFRGAQVGGKVTLGDEGSPLSMNADLVKINKYPRTPP